MRLKKINPHKTIFEVASVKHHILVANGGVCVAMGMIVTLTTCPSYLFSTLVFV